MNKEGQTLVLFIILIPILLLMAGLVIDTGYLVSKKVSLRENCKTAIKEVIDSPREEDIKKILNKNNINTDNLKIDISNNKINIKIETQIDSIFASIIGIKKYKVKVDITGYKNNGKIIFKE